MKKDGEGEENNDHMGYGEDERRKKTLKKAAGGGGGGGSGGSSLKSCQAENCSADLTDAKTYHRRHKVCEHHAKAQVVVVAGICQRFCQQCSRFHELSEFDEAKRSCRRRLAGHNERRRKNSMDTSHGMDGGGGRMKGNGATTGSSAGQLKDMGCGQSDDRSRPSGVQENANYNHHFHVMG